MFRRFDWRSLGFATGLLCLEQFLIVFVAYFFSYFRIGEDLSVTSYGLVYKLSSLGISQLLLFVGLFFYLVTRGRGSARILMHLFVAIGILLFVQVSVYWAYAHCFLTNDFSVGPLAMYMRSFCWFYLVVILVRNLNRLSELVHQGDYKQMYADKEVAYEELALMKAQLDKEKRELELVILRTKNEQDYQLLKETAEKLFLK